VFDTTTKQLINSFEAEEGSSVSGMAVAKGEGADLVAYIAYKSLHLVDLSNIRELKAVNTRSIKREARLTAIAVKNDGQSVAVGDEFGKIYHILVDSSTTEQGKRLVVQTLHWHANAV
jgi:hypothetical protein